MSRVAVIGAGIAGLTLARELAQRAEVVVFEKSSGYGGRMATRVAAPYEFDHGAQFFTARSTAFVRFLQPFIDSGLIARWDAEFVEIDGVEIINRRSWADGPAHYVCVPRMNRLGKQIAAALDVRLETRVERLLAERGWRLLDQHERDLGTFDWVITALPAAQAHSLLPESFAGRAALAQKNMLACYSLMLGYAQPLALDWQAAFVANADISWISNNSSKPGRPPGYTLLVHSTNRWAEANFEREWQAVIDYLLEQLRRVVGIDVAHADHIGLQRWRYANIQRQAGAAFFLDRPARLAAIGDWCIHGRIEAAFTSARRLAGELAQSI